MDHTDTITSVLLGFNPVERARTTVIEGWTKTFADVVARMQASKQGNIAHTNPPAFSLSLEALVRGAQSPVCKVLSSRQVSFLPFFFPLFVCFFG